jgi:hypothetical protein
LDPIHTAIETSTVATRHPPNRTIARVIPLPADRRWERFVRAARLILTVLPGAMAAAEDEEEGRVDIEDTVAC